MVPVRRGGHASKDNHERWLLTYSDLITLLMIFFVVMYAISDTNAQKMAALANSLAQTLTGAPTTGILTSGGLTSIVPGIAPAPGQGDEGAELARARAELQQYIQQEGLESQVTLNTEERGLVVSVADAVLFPKGSADLTPEARALLRQVGRALARLPNYLRVEGHTDNLPINTPAFPSNWELSTARATNVVKVLISEAGIKPERLSATGYGEYRPVAPNNSEADMARNRRVDIVVLKEAYNVTEPHKGEK
ncbi:Motility protein B [Moorella thermoacetica]|uniref:Motility protein B n=1 Tax=Neomoorella thermoacetica TaxID=1525 RepID=A0AAC9HFP4_NEOTH|nr:flagellar motor protein MotB [Moorella thermoacetica]AOQ22871.1 Motility protein B [Moorella thermoacetica]TYL09989.1 Motility protein B [Moorella thermoacetica]